MKGKLVLLVAGLCAGYSVFAENTVFFRENFEGENPMLFRSCAEPTVYRLGEAEKKGLVKIHRAGITTQEEGKSHGDVRSFALDVTLDNLNGRWGGTASWIHRKRLSIPLNKPVYLTAYVYPEQLPADMITRVEMGVIFDGEKDGRLLRNGVRTFWSRGVDSEGWMVFQTDVSRLVQSTGYENPVMTGWVLIFRGPHHSSIRNQRLKLFLDDVSITSEPEKINVTSDRSGQKISRTNIPAGPHTVGYSSLYRDYPEDARNRIWNSSFENGIAHWHLEVSGGKKTLPEFDKTFQIVKGKGIHGNSYLQVSRPDGEANHVRISTMPVQIQDGKDYIFSFYAKASKDGETILCNGLKIRLSTTWKRYVLPLTSIKPETYSWSGKRFPNRRTFSFRHQGNASILLDAVQLEQGRMATEFEYPEMVSLSVRPANRLGLYLPNEKPEVQWTLFNGYPEERRVTVILRIRDFAHRPVKTMTFHRTLAAGAGITELVPMPAGYHHYKVEAELQTRNGNRQTVDTAVSVVKDLTAVPGRDFFGQLGAAGRNPGNFADGLRLNQLLGVRNLLVYNNLRLDWETDWRTNRSYPEQRNLLIDRIRAAGFEPELAIKPLGKFNRDPYGVEIVGPEELEEIRAWTENFARAHRHNLKRYEVFGEYMQGYLPPRARNVAAILPVVYHALKKASPSCLVDAFAEDNIPGIEAELEAHFKLGTLQYADRVTIHPYWIARQNQEGLDTGLKQVRNLVNRYAKQKPIAANESGHRAVDTLYYDDIEPESMYYALYCTELEQAERTVREHLIAIGNGLTAYTAFYTYPGERFFSFSYVQTGNSIRPKTVFPAYNFMVSELAGANLLKVIARPVTRLRIYVFRKGGETFAAMWHYADDFSARNIKLNLNPTEVRLWNLVGEAIPLSGEQLEFPLDGSVVYLHAGSYSTEEFIRALEDLRMDLLKMSVVPESEQQLHVLLENGSEKRIGVLGISGGTTQTITLEPEEKRSVLIPAHSGRQTVFWKDPQQTLQQSLTLFPVGRNTPSVHLGAEHRFSRFPQFTEFAYRGEKDLSADFHASYDEKNFYLEINVRDDIFFTPYSSDHKMQYIWANDAVQIAFDNLEEPSYIEFSCSLTPKGPEMITGDSWKSIPAQKPRIDLSQVLFKASREGDRIRYRFTIPWRSMWKHFRPSGKPQIRFNLVVVDNDGPPKNKELDGYFLGDKQSLLFTPGIMTGKNSKDFSWLIFRCSETEKQKQADR